MALGEIILSAVLPVLLEKLPVLLGKLVEVKAVDLVADVDSLRSTLLTISAVIHDAEKRQDDNHIRLWLQHLREETYNACDVLDEVAYEVQRQRHVYLSTVRNSSLSIFSMRRWRFGDITHMKIITTINKLDKLVNESRVFNLSEATRSTSRGRTVSEITPVGDSIVYGRAKDSHIILEYLLSNEYSISRVDFIAILGKAGLGKTTLAQVVFNDESVVEHFHIQVWVHALYQDVDEKALVKAIIESITRRTCDLPNLTIMQQNLLHLLEGKKYLLVLDGLSNDTPEFLVKVKEFLSGVGASGSKVLITTQKRLISKLIDKIYIHELKSLSNKDCGQVIRKSAFSDQNPNPHLNRIIETIGLKCDGLPLAAKRYGMLLSIETEREKWELISRKEVGEVIGYGITQTLSSNTRRCFAYCSIFPWGYLFDKQKLVQLWLAQDFVRDEDEGSEYFDSMFNCCLFNYAHLDYAKTVQTYAMDDDIRSRAQLISGEECHIMYPGNSDSLSKMARHASLLLSTEGSRLSSLPWSSSSSHSPRNMEIDIESVYEANGLYTLILLDHPINPVMKQIPEKFPEKLQRLRSLDLSNTGLIQLPDSIGNLKHLRYLCLHNTKIKKLPNSLSELYHLQTLGLRNCYELNELPQNMRQLTNLRHLDLHLDDDSEGKCGALRSMPPKFGKLTSLRTLSRFVLSKNDRCGISELKDIKDLHGDLMILGLESVKHAVDAKDARLDNKEHLRMLGLQWGEDAQDRRIDLEVLNCLRPHNNIRELRIGGYRGNSLSSWIADPSFSSLEALKLCNCLNFDELPPLSQLCSLKKLQLERLPNCKSWSGHGDRKFPSLQELVIRDCVNLSRLPSSLPALQKFEIDGCPNILGLPKFPSLRSLIVKDSDKWIWSSLRYLSSVSSLVLVGLPYAPPQTGLQTCTSMERLEISNFVEVYCLPDNWLTAKLSHFNIQHCPDLQSLPLSLASLQHLSVLQVRHCQELLSLPTGMSSLRSLKYLELSDCPRLSFVLRDGLPKSLQTLIIDKCVTLIEQVHQEWYTVSCVPKVWINGDLVVLTETTHSNASTSQGSNYYN